MGPRAPGPGGGEETTQDLGKDRGQQVPSAEEEAPALGLPAQCGHPRKMRQRGHAETVCVTQNFHYLEGQEEVTRDGAGETEVCGNAEGLIGLGGGWRFWPLLLQAGRLEDACVCVYVYMHVCDYVIGSGRPDKHHVRRGLEILLLVGSAARL